MTRDLPFSMSRSVDGTKRRPFFVFSKSVWNDWCLDCIARRVLLGCAGALVVYGLGAGVSISAQSDPTAGELQREETNTRQEVNDLRSTIQKLSMQAAVLEDQEKHREEKDGAISKELIAILGGMGLFLAERVISSLGGKFRDNTRDHEPVKRRSAS